jgi:hypothetical protein
MMFSRKQQAFLLVGLALSLPPRASAQNADAPLAQLLPRLLSEAVTMPSTAAGVAGNPHEAHFLPDVAQLEAPYALNAALVSQLATFPLGSSSGGFTYTGDPVTGVPERSSNNFGPAFAERALTIGRGRFSVGFNYQFVEYDRFEGLSLPDREVAFYLRHNECCGFPPPPEGNQNPDGTPRPGAAVVPTIDSNPAFEGDLVEARLSLTARTQTMAFFANYGLTDRLDVSVAIPLVRVELDATMDSTLIRLGTGENRAVHSFASAGFGGDPDRRTSGESGSASGLGDILFRGKYNFWTQPGGGLAVAVDLRLPSGDEENLLGTGATQIRPSIIYSQDYGRISPHFNIGYTLSRGSLSGKVGQYSLGDELPPPIATAPNAYLTVFRGEAPGASRTNLDIPDEVNTTVGVVVGASPRVTVSFDAIGRTLLSVNRFGLVPQTYTFRTVNGGPTSTRTFEPLDLTTRDSRLNLWLGVVGAKLNVARTLLLTANVLFALNNQGLHPKPTLVLGVDYAL